MFGAETLDSASSWVTAVTVRKRSGVPLEQFSNWNFQATSLAKIWFAWWESADFE